MPKTDKTQPPPVLTMTPNIADPDGFYQFLVESQRALTEDQANAMNARLVLILCNHIGDATLLRQAIIRARDLQQPF